jgi:hypothetical protein
MAARATSVGLPTVSSVGPQHGCEVLTMWLDRPFDGCESGGAGRSDVAPRRWERRRWGLGPVLAAHGSTTPAAFRSGSCIDELLGLTSENGAGRGRRATRDLRDLDVARWFHHRSRCERRKSVGGNDPGRLHDWRFDAKTDTDAAIVEEIYASTGRS